jgi:hypothetical protein
MDVGPKPSIRARCAAKQKPAPALNGAAPLPVIRYQISVSVLTTKNY